MPKSRIKRQNPAKAGKRIIAPSLKPGFVPIKLQPALPSLARPTGGHIAAAAALTIIITTIYGTIAWGLINGSQDFRIHLNFAKALYTTGRPSIPHFLFHALIAILVGSHLTSSFELAGRLVLVGCYVLIALLMYGLLWILFRKSSVGKPPILLLAGLATLLAQPLSLSHAYQLGYFWPEPYAIPTSTVLKPFALAGFACTVWYLSQRRRIDGRLVFLFALATAAGTLSKPNFVICVVPAAALLVAYRMARGLPVSLTGLVAGLFLPAAVVLGWQFYQTYSGNVTGGVYHDSIVWAPFKFMDYYATGLLAKFLLTILFPLVVTVLYWKQALRDVVLQLAWLCFFLGAFYSYMLVEQRHWAAGNLTWSGGITAFTLFVGSVVFWLRQIPLTTTHGWSRARVLFCGAILALHALSGARMDWLYLTHYGCPENFETAEFGCPS